MRAWAVRLAAIAAALVLLGAGGAAWSARGRLRHLAVPLLADPSLPLAPGAALPEQEGCTSAAVARVGARVSALLERGDGALWVGTFDAGLLRGIAPELSPVSGLRGRERFVNALAFHEGLVWAATQGGLVAFDPDGTSAESADGARRVLTVLHGEGVTALASAEGALYAGTARGVFRVSSHGIAERMTGAGPSGEPLRVTALAAGPRALWVGTASGAYALPLAPAAAGAPRWVPLVFGAPPAETNVVTALAAIDGGALAGTDDGGVVRLGDDGAVSALRFAEPRANEVNPGAAAASGGAALVGTQGGGVLVVRPEGTGLSARRLAATAGFAVSALHAGGARVLLGTAAGEVREVRCVPDTRYVAN